MQKKLILAGVMASVSACGGTGPFTGAILKDPNASVVKRDVSEKFAVIDVDRATAATVSSHVRSSRRTGFLRDANPGPVIIGVGDTVQISIVSTNENGFIDFANSSVAPISNTTLPDQEVSVDGTVNVPPLGRVQVAGQEVQQFEKSLAEQLQAVLVKPSVIVRQTDRRSARVAVMGEVSKPGTVSINDTDARLIDIIAAAGGPTQRPEDLLVRVSRKGQTASVKMSDLFENPRYNIRAFPGDVLAVQTPNRRVTVLGAGTTNKTLTFNEPSVTLIHALGDVGGIDSPRADRKGVFLYRELPRDLDAKLGADVSRMAAPRVPTIFRFDLTKPTAFFAAKEFEIEDGDVLYIANSLNDKIDSVVKAFSPFVPLPDEYIRDATIDSTSTN